MVSKLPIKKTPRIAMGSTSYTKKDMLKAKSASETSETNKEQKEVKKDLKDLMKGNKEVLEELVENNRKAAERMETQLDSIGEKISSAVGTEIASLARVMTQFMIKNAKKDDDPASGQIAKEKSEEEEIDSSEKMDEYSQSLPCAQSKFRTMTQSQEQQEVTPESSQEEEKYKVEQTLLKHERMIQQLLTRIEQLEKISEKGSMKEPTKENNPSQKPAVTYAEKTKAVVTVTPTLNIDWEGNKDDQDISREQHQPMDWAKVRNKWKPRPELTETMDEIVTENLNVFVEETMKQPESHGTKPQKQMTGEEREERIEKMFKRSATMVGIAPLSSQHIDRVEANLLKTGVLKRSENPMIRRQRTIKSLVKSWAMKNLGMTDRDWTSIQIEEIQVADNSDIVFIRCKSYEDAAKITANARNLPADSGPNSPRLIMHVDIRAKKRHKAILNIAKSIREISKNTVQTTLRAGRRDFLLRKREKGTATPWSQIPPLLIKQEIPEIEIGQYKDIINPSNRMEEQDEPLDEEELQQISADMKEQENEGNKRDRSGEEKLTNKKPKINKTHPLNIESSSSSSSDNETGSESDTELRQRAKKTMNSTLLPTLKEKSPPKTKSRKIKTMNPENPVKKWMTHYHSTPANPHVTIQPTGRESMNAVPETPQQPAIKEKSKTVSRIPETPEITGKN